MTTTSADGIGRYLWHDLRQRVDGQGPAVDARLEHQLLELLAPGDRTAAAHALAQEADERAVRLGRLRRKRAGIA
jgi:hypothetical protein